MTVERKLVRAKAAQAQNAGTSQAVPHKAVDNLFDDRFSIVPAGTGYWLSVWSRPSQFFNSLDDLMTFLADQAIEKIGRVAS